MQATADSTVVTVTLSLRRRLLGAARHPVPAARVLAWRLRTDPALLAARVSTLVTSAAPWLARPLRPLTRRSRRSLDAADARLVTELAAVRPERFGTSAAAARTRPPDANVVLHVVTNSLPDTSAGYTVRTHAIAVAQLAAGLQPHVATRWGYPALDGRFDAAPLDRVDEVPYHRLLPRGPIPLRLADRLARHADALTGLTGELRPAIVHAATPYLNGLPALAAARRGGLPLVYEVRGFLEDSWASADPARYSSDRYRLTRALETSVMLAADTVVTLAETMRAEIVRRGVAPDQVVVVPNAVDARLLTGRRDRAGVRDELGISRSEFVIGSVSTLTGYEGFTTLLQAAALLRDDGVAVRVLLAGDGPERAALRREADRLGLGARVLLPGRVHPRRAPDVVAALDAMCVPRIDAPVCRTVTPLKPVEAMGLGVPVIVSDLPALAELVGGGAAGVLVRPEDPAALAQAVLRLRADSGWRADLVAAARDEVAARRTWQAAAATYRDLYASLHARS